MVYSSTAAVYGNPKHIPVKEDSTLLPITPYGATKLASENMIRDYSQAYNIKSVSLRYFNVGGASEDGLIGEEHIPETHIIPLALRSTYDDDYFFQIAGDDYPTYDKTCIRDYIHVEDLALAHINSFEYLISAKRVFTIFNVGTGIGYSVREVVDKVEKVTGKKVKTKIGTRRAGDPPVLIADSSLIKEELGWFPEKSDLDTIIQSSWNFVKKKS
jgi:UDP-galactose 4-epimerase (EC 5.1.3.2)